MTVTARGALSLLPRAVALASVLGLGAGTVDAVQRWAPPRSAPPAAQTLPAAASAAAPVCPGAETLAVPRGGRPVAAGNTVLAGVVAAADLLRADGTLALGTRVSARLTPLRTAGDTSGTADGTAPPAPTPLVSDTGLASRSRGVASRRSTPRSAGPLRVEVDRTGGAPPTVAATQVTVVTSGDLRGLSTVSCPLPSTSSWLVGGGTGTGRRARLLLANPASAPAVVDVALLGPDGPVPTPTTRQVVVRAGGQVSLYLEALAPGLDALAVRVTTRSGRVAATLHDELLRGATPGGTDSVSGGGPPSTRQVVPGVVVTGDQPRDPSAPGATAVRVAVPGTGDAVVRVRLLGRDGPVDLPATVRTVGAGSVVDLPVRGVPAGAYTALVEADTPVVAGALVGRAGDAEQADDTQADDTRAESDRGRRDEGERLVVPGDLPVADLGWAPSAAAVTATAVVAAPDLTGVRADLVLGATAPARVVVVPLGRDGRPQRPRSLVLAAGRTAVVDLPERSDGALLRTVSGAVYPALVLTASDDRGPLLSVAALRPGGPAAVAEPRTVAEDPRTGLR